jgi:hypothetical protein
MLHISELKWYGVRKEEHGHTVRLDIKPNINATKPASVTSLFLQNKPTLKAPSYDWLSMVLGANSVKLSQSNI